MENVIGPAGNEPGVTLTFDGNVMALDPDTASIVGFEVPNGTPDGTYTVEIKDSPGLYEVITVVPLLRRRSASMSLVVESR